MQSAWNVGRMLDWMSGYLADHGDDQALVSARWLISDVVGMTFMELYTNLDRPLDSRELDALRASVRRRAAGEPVQYIVGKTAFRHIDVKVRPGVLIPRPETEVLVSEVLSRLPFSKYQAGDGEKRSEPTLLVADLCTGSGCVACSLAYENPAISVLATDLSPECVALARENVHALGLDERVEVLACDLGEGIDESLLGSFAAVVANPPYVPSAVLASLPEEVKGFEPELALDGGENGLEVFCRIASWASRALLPGGLLAVELFERSLEEACTIAHEQGYVAVEIARDLAGASRILLAQTPPSRD